MKLFTAALSVILLFGFAANAAGDSLTVTLPNGGENWTAGSMVDVDWTSTGSIALVNIDYSIDGGSNWLPILAGTTNDGHSGDWVLPNITSTTCLVRVSDAANAALNDVSDAFFSITIREDDIYEENDTPAAATVMAPGTYYGLILRDEDYFKVYVEAGKDLVVRTMGAAISSTDSSDIDIELFNASGDLLVATVGGSTMETLCLSNLAAGWYFIRITWYGTPHYYALGIWSGDLDLGEISGRVTDIHGSGIANIWVTFYEPSGDWNLVRGYVLTDSNGDYRFAYTAGDHKVLFECNYPTVDPSIRGKYLNEWYNDAATIDAAQTLTTAAGSSLTGINAVLGNAGWVTGTVTGPTGQPLQYAYAQAYDSSGTRISSTYTLADGTYCMGSIATAGNYRIRFRPPNGTGYAVEWYNNRSWSGAADAVAVVLGAETANINAQLGYGGTISGTVTDAVSGLPVANVTVSARDENNIVINSAVTAASGQYTIYWVPACNVKLYFNAGTTGYISEWYNDKTDFATADLVPVASGQNVAGINVQLSQPSITVISPNGGEIWAVGSGQNITWTSNGVAGSVDITYSSNGGTNWTSVAADTANDGLYSWTVPNTPSSACYVQVLEHNGSLHDSSNAAFTITTSATETISVPNIPSGPALGTTGASYAYSTSGATSSLGHAVQYLFDWDDGTTSGWLTEGNPQVSHSWGAAGTYNVRAMARCATHTTIESSWSTTLAVIISAGGAGSYNSPAQYKVLPEVIWAHATGGGTWMSSVQVNDVTGGSQVSVYYNTENGRRGPFLLWDNSAGGALSSAKYDNLLEAIDTIDTGTFTYYGTVGAVEFVTQDGNHAIHAAARTVNGNYAKTFSAISLHDSNTVYVGRAMLIPNLTNNATYRSSCGFFNPTDNSVTVELRLRDANSAQVGSTMTKTLAAHGFTAFAPFTEAGVPYPGTASDNVFLSVMVQSGSGKVVCFGASANNASNDPAAHVAVQSATGHDNGPASRQILPEAIWAPATGGGTWMSEVQLVDMSGGSQVSVYFDYGGGNRRGPFLLWTGGFGWTKVKYANILQQLGTLDALFTYYGKVGTVEFVTQDDSHLVQVTARTLNGNYSKTFPGLNAVAAETADTSRVMLIQNYTNNGTYRSTCGFYNPTADTVIVEFTLLSGSGGQIGTPFSRTLAGHDFQSFSPFNESGVPYPGSSYDNVILRVRPTSGTGSVMCFGASANNASNDPASHLAVQGQ